MLLKQYYLGCLAHASYLIADDITRTAVVVDPQRDIDQYLDDAARQGLYIRYVVLTHAVLTGDTLFIGDVGRPDLLASIGVTAQKLATMLYDSLHQKLLRLPDDTLVYPAHGAGSMCGKNLSTDTVSTIGVQRRYNYALQPMSQAAFVAMVTTDQPEAPQYFAYDAMRNRQERPTLTQTLTQALHPALANDDALPWTQNSVVRRSHTYCTVLRAPALPGLVCRWRRAPCGVMAHPPWCGRSPAGLGAPAGRRYRS